MKPTIKAGSHAAASAPGAHVPPHFLRRVARRIVLRRAVAGRMSWHVALPLLERIGGAA